MQGAGYATIKRENSATNNDADMIKVKFQRSEITQDVVSARKKEEGVEKDEGSANNNDALVHDEEVDESTRNEDDKNTTENAVENQQIGSPRNVSHGSHLVQGTINHGMEDYLVASSKKLNGHELGLYAIFNGHSGREVSQYLQGHLFSNILKQPDFWTDTKAAFKRAYVATDNNIQEHVVGATGGSTAVTAILMNGEKLIVASVGASRAVICRNGTAKRITVDHDPLKEKELVESKGDFVSKSLGNVPSVDGQLAMTRGFGYQRLKKHITVEPHIFIETIDEDVEFCILASDGLWKVMENQEAVDHIREITDGQVAAEELIREAIVRESKDDISCVVVMFE